MTIMPKSLGSKVDDIVFTPKNIAKDMVDLLPDDIFTPEARFIDIACRTGIFLVAIKNKLMASQALIDKFNNTIDREKHILDNQIYAITPDEFSLALTQRNLYGNLKIQGNKLDSTSNIRYKENYIENFIRNDRINYKQTIENMFKTKEVKEGADTEMKFDVVIGNPPYNRGMDLDFVNMGFDLCTKYCVMITPAKWQTAAGDQRVASTTINYGQFREQLVPHMSKVVFYPMSSDVFDIKANSGITYFILGKEKHELCEVINKWSCFTEYYNTTEVRGILNGETLCNIGKNIANHINTRGQFTYIREKRSDKKYCVWGYVSNTCISRFQT